MTAVIQYILYLVILVLGSSAGCLHQKGDERRENIPVQGAHPLRKPGLQGDAGEQG